MGIGICDKHHGMHQVR